MIYVFQNGSVIRTATFSEAQAAGFRGYTSRNDWKTFDEVKEIASRLTNASNKRYLPTDATESTYPRYDICEVPEVGDPVSYSFNGDSYPCGHIVSISKTYKKIVTSDGNTFYRRRLTGGWKMNGTWWLVIGHFTERNPHI